MNRRITAVSPLSADWQKLNFNFALRVAKAARDREAPPKASDVPLFTSATDARGAAAADFRTLQPIADDVLSLAGFERSDNMRFGKLLFGCARVLEVHGKFADKELVQELCDLLRRYMGHLGTAMHRARSSKNPARVLPKAGELLREAFAEVEEIEEECRDAEKHGRRLARLGFRANGTTSRKLPARADSSSSSAPPASGERQLSFVKGGSQVAVGGVAKYDANSIRKALGKGACVLGVIATAIGMDVTIECGRHGSAHSAEAHRPAGFRLSEHRLDGKAKARSAKRPRDDEPEDESADDADSEAEGEDNDDANDAPDGDEPAPRRKREGDGDDDDADAEGAAEKKPQRKKREGNRGAGRGAQGGGRGRGGRNGAKRGGRGGGRKRGVDAAQELTLAEAGAGDSGESESAGAKSSTCADACERRQRAVQIVLPTVSAATTHFDAKPTGDAHNNDGSGKSASDHSQGAREVGSILGTAAGEAGGGSTQRLNTEKVSFAHARPAY